MQAGAMFVFDNQRLKRAVARRTDGEHGERRIAVEHGARANVLFLQVDELQFNFVHLVGHQLVVHGAFFECNGKRFFQHCVSNTIINFQWTAVAAALMKRTIGWKVRPKELSSKISPTRVLLFGFEVTTAV